MLKIQIKSIFGEVLFELEKDNNTVKETVLEFLNKNKGNIIRNCDLSELDLSGLDFSNSKFDNSKFDNSTFYHSTFYHSTFDNSKFYHSTFYHSTFYHSTFYHSKFDNSKFYHSKFYHSTFYHSKFDNSTFYHSKFYNSTFDNQTIINILEADQVSLFDSYKNDLWAVLLKSIPEIAGLKQAIIDGRIKGSAYEGECACLKGTIANIRKCHYKELANIKDDSDSPSEQWFLMINEGMTPENSEIVKLTLSWIEEFESYATPRPVVKLEN